MLTEKCPHCGSYNDPSAAVCYFCQKELPSTGGRKKKRSPEKSQETSAGPRTAAPRVNRPGCLMLYIGLLFISIAALVLLLINASGGYYVLNLPYEYTEYATFLTDPLAAPENADLNTLVTQVIPVILMVFFLVLGIGLFLLQRWARILVILLQVLIAFGFGGYFYILLTRYYNQYHITSEFAIVFCVTLVMILLNLYIGVWFFEHSRNFEGLPRVD
jgi:hypothetical protein